MKAVRKSAYFCIPLIASVLLISWLLSITLEHFSGHHNIFYKGLKRGKIKAKELEDDALQMTDKYENIFTFIQISDIHISKFRYVNEIIPQLKVFCKDYFLLIKPKVVLVTGDITDAKAKDNRKSEQYVEEWISYNKLVKYCKERSDAIWLDVRGNHDAFGVPNRASSINLYNKFGAASHYFGSSRSLQYILKTSYGSYAFNGIDLAPEPGPRRPFNFFGVVLQEDVESISAMNENGKHCNLSFWFGHYPLSVTNTPSRVRELIQNGIAYLCGHLHTLGGLIPRMYARPVEGHLELEAGDWKENRRYRIMAVDHDIFSFVDAKFGEMPVVLMTNPKDARFMTPDRESIERTAKSTHIRFFVYSDAKITKVSVFIGGHLLCENARHVGGSLFVCSWKPRDYMVGLHEISVSVKDTLERETTFTSHFSLDGSMPLLDVIPAFIMLANFCVLAKMIYFTTWMLVVLFPLFIRSRNARYSNGLLDQIIMFLIPDQIKSFASKDHVFWPLFYYNCYFLVGPLFIGELVPGSIGLCFVHGIYTNGHWIPGSLTYIYGSLQVITFNIPMMLCLGNKHSSASPVQPRCIIARAQHNIWSVVNIILITFGIVFQINFCHTLYICYGALSFILSPSALWAIFLAVWLVYREHDHKNRNILVTPND